MYINIKWNLQDTSFIDLYYSTRPQKEVKSIYDEQLPLPAPINQHNPIFILYKLKVIIESVVQIKSIIFNCLLC